MVDFRSSKSARISSKSKSRASKCVKMAVFGPKIYQNKKFGASENAKTSVFQLSKSPKLISRKIWMIENPEISTLYIVFLNIISPFLKIGRIWCNLQWKVTEFNFTKKWSGVKKFNFPPPEKYCLCLENSVYFCRCHYFSYWILHVGWILTFEFPPTPLYKLCIKLWP